jgi:hypothetical protein
MKTATFIFAGEVDHFVTRRSDMKSIEASLQKWRTAPLYQKISASEDLAGSLLSAEVTETTGYRWQEGSHDCNQIAGRAAWALEEMLGIQLSPVTPGISREQLRRVHAEARSLLEAYRRGAMSLASERDADGSHIQRLKRSYAGKIELGLTMDRAPGCSAAFNRLLQEWFPLGKKVGDLDAIIGAVGEKTGGNVYYRFDNGESGVQYEVKTRDGVIVAVRISGLY